MIRRIRMFRVIWIIGVKTVESEMVCIHMHDHYLDHRYTADVEPSTYAGHSVIPMANVFTPVNVDCPRSVLL